MSVLKPSESGVVGRPMQAGFDLTLRRLRLFNLQGWGAAYNASSEHGFVDYEPQNPGLFKVDRISAWPRVKKLPLAEVRLDKVVGVELWILPFDVLAVSVELKHSGSIFDLKNLSLSIKANTDYDALAERLATAEFADQRCEVMGDDDNQYIQIRDAVKEEILDEEYQAITAILTGHDERFSDAFTEEIMDNVVPYTRDTYAYLGSRCVIQVNTAIDDLLCLWIYQCAYVRKNAILEGFLDKRLQQTYKLLTRPRHLIPLSSFSHSELQSANPFMEHTLETVENISLPLEIFGVGFFSLANDAIGKVLEVGDWQNAIKEKYDDLENSFEHLENIYAFKNQQLLEWLIVLVIVLSVVITLRYH
jgi:hypothetical protein